MFAIAEFGSLSRNESDLYSDRDLLIICPHERRKDYITRYESEGYSVSLLTEKQLLFMKRKGSLFLQHLKFESKIIYDSKLKLSSFLNTCDLIKPTPIEINTCQSSIEFLSEWPNIIALNAWKADFLFCLSRDYLIKRLALKGVIAFGLKDIEIESKNLFNLAESDFRNLSVLRKVKAAYRSNHTFPDNFEVSTDEWLSTLKHTFSFRNKVDNDTLLSIKNIASHDFHTPYEKLRSLEALYLIFRTMGYTHPKHKMIMNVIQKPNLYGSTKIFNQKKIEFLILEIEKKISTGTINYTSFPLRYASLQSRH